MSNTAIICNALIDLMRLPPATFGDGYGYTKWEAERSKIADSLLEALHKALGAA